jgi:alpha-tubulin suppressor-like RCC1 family protein
MTLKAGNLDFDQYFITSDEILSRYITNRVVKWRDTGFGYGNTSVAEANTAALIDTNAYQKVACERYNGIRSFGIKKDGTLWAWGDNTAGALGAASPYFVESSPVVVGSYSKWSKIAPGYIHTLAITPTENLAAWGSNEFGQLGIPNTLVNQSAPVGVTPLNYLTGNFVYEWKKVHAGLLHSLAIDSNNTLYTCGLNNWGQLGHSVSLLSTSGPFPVQYSSSFTPMLYDVDSIGAGTRSSYAIKTDRTLWAWGENSYGQLGDNTVEAKSSPVQIGNFKWLQVEGGDNFAIGLRDDNTIWKWGRGIPGSVEADKSAPVQIGTSDEWQKISTCFTTAYAVSKSGSLYGIGGNSYGEISADSFARYTSLTLVHPEQFVTDGLSNTTYLTSGMKTRTVYDISGPIAIILNT